MSASGSTDSCSVSAFSAQLPQALQINQQAFGNKNLSCLSASQNWQIQRWVRASIAPLTSAGMKPCLPDLICSFQSGKVRDRDKQAPKDASEVRQLQA